MRPSAATSRPRWSDTEAELQEEVAFHTYVQYLFFTQWAALKARCERAGASI